MSKEITIKNKRIHVCDVCGFGYKGKKTAMDCQRWCNKHASCNLKITGNAIYFPKSS